MDTAGTVRQQDLAPGLLRQVLPARSATTRAPAVNALPEPGAGTPFGRTGASGSGVRALQLATRDDSFAPSAMAARLASSGRDRAVWGGRDVPHLRRDISLWSDTAALVELLRLLARVRPRILHTHTSKAGFLGRWAAWLLNRTVLRREPIRTVHTPHGHVFQGYFGPVSTSFLRLLERATAHVTDRLVAVSEGERRETLAHGVGAREQWVVIPAGTSLPARRPPQEAAARVKRACGFPEGALVAGTVARLEPVKGVRFLVEAADMILRDAESRGKDVRFIIVGDGSLRERLESLAERLGKAGFIHFAGHQADVLPWLSAMDVYVQSSLNEAMGQALLLAQSMGIPAVGTRVGGIPDVVREGRSALLVPPGDGRALARAIKRLLLEPGLRKRLAEGARAASLRKDGRGELLFGEERMVRLHEELYREMLSSAR